jgi:hypothetical protein
LQHAELASHGRLAPRAVRRSRRVLQRAGVGTSRRSAEENPQSDPEGDRRQDVLVLCSGNLAHVYFGELPKPLGLEEIEERYPMLTTRLAKQTGIGFIACRSGGRGPLAIGSDGIRQMQTGQVWGEDPLAPFGDPCLVATQMLRVIECSDAGDLVINGSLLNGKVTTFEEHVGSHGGLGGAQNEPFIMLPRDMKINADRITSAVDLYTLLRHSSSFRS